MRITLLVVGRVRGPLADAITGYEERAGHYWKLEVIEVDAGAAGGASEAVRAAEEERLLKRLPEHTDLVALTRAGQPMGSRAFASYLETQAVHARDLCFLIGGAFGLGDELLRKARQLTLSPMTFPHEMARLLFAEQLYRAGTILRGEPYHKGP